MDDVSKQIAVFLNTFTSERYERSVADGDIGRDLDPRGYCLGYAAALFDIIEFVIQPQIHVSDPRDVAFVHTATTMGVLSTINTGLRQKIAPVLEDTWKVPTE